MRKLRPFLERSFAVSTQYDTELSGDVLQSVAINFDAHADTGTSATARQDAVSRVIGTPEVVQAEEPLIRMSGRDWRHLAALQAGGYPDTLEPNLTTTNHPIAHHSRIHFGSLLRGSLIDATRDKAFVRGTFGGLTDYAASGVTLIDTGTIRPVGETVDVDASAGYWRPRIRQRVIDLSSADLDIQEVIRFEETTKLVGFMLRQSDADVDAGARVDGLVRGVRIDAVTGSRGQRELTRSRWGPLRDDTRARTGFNTEDMARSVGIALLMLVEDAEADNVPTFQSGDSITFHVDTSSTVEARYTAVTPANGDQLIVTLLAFTRVAGRGPSGSPTVSPRVAPERFAGRTRDLVRRVQG